jgi:WD40 repeat protein
MRHVGPISGVACHQGRYIATAGYDNQVILWDAATGAGLARGLHDHLVNQCDFDPRGEFLLTASSDYSARLWTLPGMHLARVLTGHDDDVMKAAFSPDGSLIATCSYDGTLGVYGRDGVMRQRMSGHLGLIEGFDWSRDGRIIHSCGTDGTVRSWDAATGDCVQVRSFDGIDLDALVTLKSGGFYTGDNLGRITHVGSEGGTRRFEGHGSGVKRLIVHPDEHRLISLAYDNSLILWDILADQSLRLAQRTLYPDCVWARSAAFLDETRVVLGAFGSKYAQWNCVENTWDLDGVEPILGLNSVIESGGSTFAIGDSGLLRCDGRVIGGPRTLCNFLVKVGNLILTGGQKGVVYDAVSGEELYAHHAPLNCGVAFPRAGGTHVAVGSYSGDLLVFRVAQGVLVLDRVIKAHENAIKGVSTDGARLFSGCADGELAVYDAETLERLRFVHGAHDGILNDTCAYEKGFATISRDLTLRLWSEGEPTVLKSHHGNSIKCLASDAAGVLIATGSYGGTIEVFDTLRGEWLSPVVRPTASGVSSLAWHSERNHFLASSYDGVVYEVAVDRTSNSPKVSAKPFNAGE